VLGAALVAASLAPAARAATPTAQYDARFDATWSASTHPFDFPPNPHFSSLIGGTHDSNVSFWNPGELASQGIKDMAERGLTTPLDHEVEAAIAAGHAGVVILGGGIALSPGTVTTSFEISQTHPLVTLVSMVAPSPDWFVGVSGLPLFVAGDWVETITVELFTYDAGTDCGTFYRAPNCISTPRELIALSSAMPFTNGVPLGTFTFTRTDSPTDVLPGRTSIWLAQSAPNPARDELSIRYSLLHDGESNLSVYDAAGRVVRTLQDGVMPAGVHLARWDRRTSSGALAPAGIYYYELRTREARLAKRLVLLR
jgi:hypothetical protein